ncbi:MAG: hypothetical protein JWN32_259 [Solirubrobacterales bacterium]|nr:hypothetical protein [Solirubrobacterales bacterium]
MVTAPGAVHDRWVAIPTCFLPVVPIRRQWPLSRRIWGRPGGVWGRSPLRRCCRCCSSRCRRATGTAAWCLLRRRSPSTHPRACGWHAEPDRAIARATRTGEALTVATLDVDDFKTYNDTHGHDEDRAMGVLERISRHTPPPHGCSIGLAAWMAPSREPRPSAAPTGRSMRPSARGEPSRKDRGRTVAEPHRRTLIRSRRHRSQTSPRGHQHRHRRRARQPGTTQP